jgi:hypothetical protein
MVDGVGVVICVWYGIHSGGSRVGKKASLMEGCQVLQCGEVYLGIVGSGSFPGIFQGADQRLP